LDADGEIIAQFDTPPLDGLYPTDSWLLGQIVPDPHILTLPESTRALAVGLYDPTSMTRLPVTDASGERLTDDAIKIPIAGAGR
jgi:hypothetical protein